MSVGVVPGDASSQVGRRGLPAPGLVRVSVVGSERAQRAGLGLFGFSVSNARAGTGGESAVRVSMDYDDFRYAFGGDWADRLQLVRYPACVLTTPDKDGCSQGEVVETSNDVELGVISADLVVDDLEAVTVGVDGLSSSGTVGDGLRVRGLGAGLTGRRVMVGGSGASAYGWSNGYTSDFGSFAATPLSVSSSWSVGLGMGSFDWSYPVPMPPSGFGAAPAVGFNYSSAGVDGAVADENNQGLLGVGWGLASGGFIERSYRSCSADGGALNDFCWFSDNATLSLNGRSSELVLVSTSGNFTEWRLKDDPGWRVQRQLNAASSATDQRGEIWRVWSSDGTEYTFGLRSEQGNGVATNSVWNVPVVGNHVGEPCNTAPNNWCQQAWRWNLDRVRDRDGNVITYLYQAEVNKYGANGSPGIPVEYVRGGYLSEIRYGAHQSAPGDYRARVVFNMKQRCQAVAANTTCFAVGANTTPFYPDVPTDLECAAASCPKTAPSFFTKFGLASIDTMVRERNVAVNGDFDATPPTVGTLPTGSGVNYLRIDNAGGAQATTGYLQMSSPVANGSVHVDYAVPLAAGTTVEAVVWVRSLSAQQMTAHFKVWALGNVTNDGIGQTFVADATWRPVTVSLPVTVGHLGCVPKSIWARRASIWMSIRCRSGRCRRGCGARWIGLARCGIGRTRTPPVRRSRSYGCVNCNAPATRTVPRWRYRRCGSSRIKTWITGRMGSRTTCIGSRR